MFLIDGLLGTPGLVKDLITFVSLKFEICFGSFSCGLPESWSYLEFNCHTVSSHVKSLRSRQRKGEPLQTSLNWAVRGFSLQICAWEPWEAAALCWAEGLAGWAGSRGSPGFAQGICTEMEMVSIRVTWRWSYVIIWPWTVQMCFQGRDLAAVAIPKHWSGLAQSGNALGTGFAGKKVSGFWRCVQTPTKRIKPVCVWFKMKLEMGRSELGFYILVKRWQVGWGEPVGSQGCWDVTQRLCASRAALRQG